MKKIGISNLLLFSPAYNVGETIGKGLEMFEDLAALLKLRGCKLELLIINDNSSDDTGEILEKFSASHQFLTVKNNETNLRNAANIITGYNWAIDNVGENINESLIGCLDADGEHNPLAFRKHIEYITEEGFDGVVGSIIYPDHRIGWLDMHMMRFNGGLQAAMMGISEPFYIQSPGHQLHRVKYLKEAVKNLFPRYQEFFAKQSNEKMPAWGMHAVFDSLVSIAGGKLKSVYLECFNPPPNRDAKKLMEQAWAAMLHARMLAAFGNQVALGKT